MNSTPYVLGTKYEYIHEEDMQCCRSLLKTVCLIGVFVLLHESPLIIYPRRGRSTCFPGKCPVTETPGVPAWKTSSPG